MITFDEFGDILARASTRVRPQLVIGLNKVGEYGARLAHSYIGHERPEWPPLAQATIEDKQRHGYPIPAPLLRTGEMRDSIRHELNPGELSVTVGSPSPIALYQELGTSRGIPPRPFLGLALQHSVPFAVETFGEIAVGLFK